MAKGECSTCAARGWQGAGAAGRRDCGAALWRFVKRQWLLICFVIAVLFAMLLPVAGRTVLSVQSGGFRIVRRGAAQLPPLAAPQAARPSCSRLNCI
jgi:hypothetical protein